MATANIGIPWLPQQNITEGILQAIQTANQEHFQQQENAARQRQLDVAQQEANTAASRLSVETPLINAQVSEAQNRARAQALSLAQEQRAQDYMFGDSSGTAPHPTIAATMGSSNLIHPDVETTAPAPQPSQAAPPVSTPLAPPDQLNVANPVGHNLSSPAAPDSTATPQGSSVTAPKLSPLDRDTQESIRLAGGVSPSELAQIQFLRQQLSFNPTHDGVVNYWNGVHALLTKRTSDPTVAASIAFQRQGLSEPEAQAAAVRNTNIANQLDKMDADPAVLSDKAPTAIAQLQGLLKNPNLTPDVRAHIERNLAVAKTAQSNALAFDAAKKRQDDQIANGDPKILARMLVDGDAAWSQLVSTRKPEFLVQVATYAKAYDPNFSIATNEANYKRATDPSEKGNRPER